MVSITRVLIFFHLQIFIGGGVYYLVSRSLGPEFGGSIGLIYFLGTVIGCGMNVLGFVEPLISNFGESSGTVYRVLPEGPVLYHWNCVLPCHF